MTQREENMRWDWNSTIDGGTWVFDGVKKSDICFSLVKCKRKETDMRLKGFEI